MRVDRIVGVLRRIRILRHRTTWERQMKRNGVQLRDEDSLRFWKLYPSKTIFRHRQGHGGISRHGARVGGQKSSFCGALKMLMEAEVAQAGYAISKASACRVSQSGCVD